MVVEEVRAKEEEARQAKAAGKALQGGRTQWESVKPRTLSWCNILTMEPMLSRFLIKSTYDALPKYTNPARGILDFCSSISLNYY